MCSRGIGVAPPSNPGVDTDLRYSQLPLHGGLVVELFPGENRSMNRQTARGERKFERVTISQQPVFTESRPDKGDADWQQRFARKTGRNHEIGPSRDVADLGHRDRKSTRLNSSHANISYA